MRKKIILGFSSFIFVGLISGIFYFIRFLGPTNFSGAKNGVEVNIVKGMGVNEISDLLFQKGLIKSRKVFKVYALIRGEAIKILPGVYELNSNETAGELLKDISKGPKVIELIIVPGSTLKEIDDNLSAQKITPKGSIENFDISQLVSEYSFLNDVKSLEGFLYPDTYQFFANTEPKIVVKKILDNFKRKISSLGSVSYKQIIIASILEKEVIENNDARIVAGILEKRMKKGMRLQVDATVVYAVCNGRFGGCGQLNREDYLINSPYNTYRFDGLPPAPISNPTINSISAVIHPTDSAYLYYLSDPATKKTIFAKTLYEQNVNRVKYLK